MEGTTVTTRGEALVPGRPDEGIWTIAMDSLGTTPDVSLADVGARSRELDGLLDELGIPKEMRSTTGVTVREEHEYLEGKQVHRGYRAAYLMTVRLADPAVSGRLIQGSIARVKANVRGPAWWIAPDNPARLEACRRAALQAKRKAEAYAEALGLRLGPVAGMREPSTVQEYQQGGRMEYAMLDASPSPIDVDPGELDVGAQVEVSFHLEESRGRRG